VELILDAVPEVTLEDVCVSLLVAEVLLAVTLVLVVLLVVEKLLVADALVLVTVLLALVVDMVRVPLVTVSLPVRVRLVAVVAVRVRLVAVVVLVTVPVVPLVLLSDVVIVTVTLLVTLVVDAVPEVMLEDVLVWVVVAEVVLEVALDRVVLVRVAVVVTIKTATVGGEIFCTVIGKAPLPNALLSAPPMELPTALGSAFAKPEVTLAGSIALLEDRVIVKSTVTLPWRRRWPVFPESSDADGSLRALPTDRVVSMVDRGTPKKLARPAATASPTAG
jgi:hypothetical protein